jgi:cell division septal protein FtsQ
MTKRKKQSVSGDLAAEFIARLLSQAADRPEQLMPLVRWLARVAAVLAAIVVVAVAVLVWQLNAAQNSN